MGLLGKTSPINKLKNTSITVYDFLKYIFTYYRTLWWENGFSILDLITKCEAPYGRNHIIDDYLNLVFVLPEVQPRLDEFQATNIKFVGPAVDESVRSKLSNRKLDMDKYVTIIESFLEKSALQKINNNNNSNISINRNISNSHEILAESNSLHLKTDLMRSDSNGENFKKMYKPIIYVSMGTVFNNENKHLFQVLVEACKFYAKDYSIIVSTGDETTYERYKSSNSDTILFVPHTPQVEILVTAFL